MTIFQNSLVVFLTFHKTCRSLENRSRDPGQVDPLVAGKSDCALISAAKVLFNQIFHLVNREVRTIPSQHQRLGICKYICQVFLFMLRFIANFSEASDSGAVWKLSN